MVVRLCHLKKKCVTLSKNLNLPTLLLINLKKFTFLSVFMKTLNFKLYQKKLCGKDIDYFVPKQIYLFPISIILFDFPPWLVPLPPSPHPPLQQHSSIHRNGIPVFTSSAVPTGFNPRPGRVGRPEGPLLPKYSRAADHRCNRTADARPNDR